MKTIKPLIAILPSLLALSSMLSAEPESKILVPKISGEYVHIYKPEGKKFLGPSTAGLIADDFYEEWVPNDHCFVKDDHGRWHAFGITHPITDLEHIHAGEHSLFHAVAPEGDFQSTLTEGAWKDHELVLPPAERPGENEAIHAPTIIRRNGLYHMIYGPTPMRYAVSEDLEKWTPKGKLPNTPEGRDPNIFLWEGTYHLIVCGKHDVSVSTSTDFENWTEQGAILKMKEGVDPESPTLLHHNGTFYLFVCGWDGKWDRKELQGAYRNKTYVFQSDNPLKFDLKNEIAVLETHAPEIFQDEKGDWFISSVEWPNRGVSIAPLTWGED